MSGSEESTAKDHSHSELVVMGTGTSVGIPVAGCRCEVCLSDDPRNKRTRTGVLVRAPDGEFVIDTGPELRLQLVRHQAELVRSALFTHAHADHIMGLDDLRIFGFRLEAPIPLFCEESVEDGLRRVFFYAFQDPANHAHKFAAPNLTFERIQPGCRFDLLGLSVLPIRLKHGKLPILGFRIGDVAFCTDVSSIPSASEEFLQDLDVLIIDALRPEPHPTHMHLDLALKTIDRLRPSRAYLTHLSHSFDHQKLADLLPDGVEPAYDGLTISLPNPFAG